MKASDAAVGVLQALKSNFAGKLLSQRLQKFARELPIRCLVCVRVKWSEINTVTDFSTLVFLLFRETCYFNFAQYKLNNKLATERTALHNLLSLRITRCQPWDWKRIFSFLCTRFGSRYLWFSVWIFARRLLKLVTRLAEATVVRRNPIDRWKCSMRSSESHDI